MSGNAPDKVAANLFWEGDCDGPQMNVDVVDCIKDLVDAVDCIRDIDISLESVSKSELEDGHIVPTVKTAHHSHSNYPMPVESTEDGEKKVPAIKIGVSSELQKDWGYQHDKNATIKAENTMTETDINFDDNNKTEHSNKDFHNNGVEDGVKSPFEASEKALTETNNKTGEVFLKKKRGRPSQATLALREKKRQEALARGEQEPELKRKRNKPKKISENTTSGEDKSKKKKRKKKSLTEAEMTERYNERKQKMKELNDIKKKKLERRKEERRMYFRRLAAEKKAKREEEKKKQDEYLKRMADLRSQYLENYTSDKPTDNCFPLDENIKKHKALGEVNLSRHEGPDFYNPLAHVTSETLFEYKWPLEGRLSEHFFLQEQVTEYLGVKSFKRKYPDCPRRSVHMEERNFLIEMNVVNTTQADLGLTAIPSAHVLDIMCDEFYNKYEEYIAVVNTRKERTSRNYNYSSGGGKKVDVKDVVRAAAIFNKKLNRERRSKRSAYFDLQTFRCHYPIGSKMSVIQKPNFGHYPVAMITGQFVDHYKTYTSQQLNRFPLSTIVNTSSALDEYESDSSCSSSSNDGSLSYSAGSA